MLLLSVLYTMVDAVEKQRYCPGTEGKNLNEWGFFASQQATQPYIWRKKRLYRFRHG